MSIALIIGASRGIGHELARQYRADGWRVIATVRRQQDAPALLELGCEVLQLDVNKVEDCAAIGWQLADERLDVAVLVSGIYGPRTDGLFPPAEPDFDAVMHTNVLAAMRLLPIVGPQVASVRGSLAVISSVMGSIGARTSAHGWLYRASKAALNSVLADTALTFGPQGARCVSFHPGWVRTDMGGAGAAIDVETSAAGIRKTLANLSPDDNGRFLNYDGTPIAW